jgi:predicted alpha/beta hydrolase family esterase
MTTLIVPGLHGSGPDHWQSWWQATDAGSIRVAQQDWAVADLASWRDAVVAAIDAQEASVWIVAHSFGCLASVAAIRARPGRVAGAFLAAPADPDRFELRRHLEGPPLAAPSLLVASSNDPWLSLLKAAWWGQQWGSRLVSIGAAGHVNPASGFGPWIEGMGLFRDFARSVAAGPRGEIDGNSMLWEAPAFLRHVR